MRRGLSDYLKEADEIIEKRASQSSAPTVSDDEIVKLASLLTQQDAPKVEGSSIKTLTEKVAHAVALVDTLMNLDELNKLNEFEKQAREAGHSEEKIQEFLDKAAGVEKIKSVLKSLKVPAVVAAGSLAGGAAIGQSKGQEKGYRQALEDVNEAFRQHAEQG